MFCIDDYSSSDFDDYEYLYSDSDNDFEDFKTFIGNRSSYDEADVIDLRSFILNDNCTSHQRGSPDSVTSLLDLSAKVAAKYYSYSYMESLYTHIPEPVAKKFMFWSFPRNPIDLVRYLGEPSDECIVEDVMQIGFQVSGCCRKEGQYDMVLYIDRCVITSASCSCRRNKLPCEHIRALAYYRYRNADSIPIHMPISDSLNTLNRDQLLYLVKFVINKHSSVLLHSAQLITNELLDEKSEKNAQPGAPDPTAGGDMYSEPAWLKRH